jgi:membrane peptidoglycan carboxypeptidase
MALGRGSLDLPDEALGGTRPQYARGGGRTTIGNFEQRRTLLAQKDIPKVFLQALVAVEDANFYEHGGIDLKGIARAAWHDLTTMSFEQGASTLTQQLSRNLFLKPDKTPRRKMQEMLLAMEIERRYSKDEILRMYCNQVYMGHGHYGLEAASQYYLGKHASELDLAESALLAGLIQRPEGLSPFKNPEAAVRRRSHVLDRMVAAKAITPGQAEEAKREPLVLSTRRESTDVAPYFTEEVRRTLQSKYGEEGIYQGGLEVKTGIDIAMQRAANRAVDQGLRQLDKRRDGAVGSVGSPPAKSRRRSRRRRGGTASRKAASTTASFSKLRAAAPGSGSDASPGSSTPTASFGPDARIPRRSSAAATSCASACSRRRSTITRSLRSSRSRRWKARWSRSTREPGRSVRSSAASTSGAASSTGRCRRAARPARRSSRSSTPRRCERG